MSTAQDCESCGMKTTGRSGITGRPLCSRRIYLADSPLENGICSDRRACADRCLPLF